MDTDKDFAVWYRGLDEPARVRFLRRARLKRSYIEAHLLAPYKIPRAEAMQSLATASERFTIGELAAWFYEASIARRQRSAQRAAR